MKHFISDSKQKSAYQKYWNFCVPSVNHRFHQSPHHKFVKNYWICPNF